MNSNWPHAVPQQIMDVEFKLFGAFSLKQFLKILYACIIGFVIYFIEFIPLVIRAGIIGFIVLLGFAFAIVPKFEIKFFNFLKALFISPRYIWIREYKIPEILSEVPESTGESVIAVSKSANKKKISLDDELINQIIQSRSQSKLKTYNNNSMQPNNSFEKEEDFDPLERNNIPPIFDQVYNRYYGEATNTSNQKSQKSIHNLVNKKESLLKTGQKYSIQNEFKPSFSSIEEYVKEIKKLKFDLDSIKYNPNQKDKAEEILERINNLINELRILKQKNTTTSKAVQVITKGSNTVISDVNEEKKNVFGLVLDKLDNPIEGATVKFYRNNIEICSCISDKKGKFITPFSLPYGEYNIMISDNGKHKFNAYKIIIADKNIPGYKLRAK